LVLGVASIDLNMSKAAVEFQQIPGKVRFHQEPKRISIMEKLSDRGIGSLVGMGKWFSPLSCSQPVSIFRTNAETTDTLTRRIIES
jgi:hypothetical protein